MSALWQKAFAYMTREADQRRVVAASSILAISAVLFTLPYFHYLIFVVLEDEGRFPKGLSPWGFLLTQLFLLLILWLLSAMVGFSFSRRFKLPGFGNPKDFINAIPTLFALAGIMIALSYYLFDRHFFLLSPLSYPKGTLYVISLPFEGALTEEVILRLGLVTLSIGLIKRKSAGIVFVSGLGALFTIPSYHLVGIPFVLNRFIITQLCLSFTANLILGYLFVTHGFLYCMALKFFLGMKYAIVAWTMG